MRYAPRRLLSIGLAMWSVAAALTVGCKPSQDRSDRAPSTDLVPDQTLVRYRYPTTRDAAAQVSSIIKQLEERTGTPVASPEDLGELADLYVRRALLAGDVEDYRRAEDMANRSLALRASANGASVVLAKVASARHEFRKAIEIAREAARIRSTAGAHDLIATAFLALGDLEEASAAAEVAVTLNATPTSFLTRALVLQAQGRDAEAAFDFTQAVKVETHGDPEQAARIRALWGRFLLRRGELDGAALVIGEALRVMPGEPFSLAQAAELALRSGKFAEARASFEQAFASSRQVRYLIDLARAQELSRDLPGATRSRDQVVQLVRRDLADNGVGHQLDLVEVLLDRGTSADVPEAVKLATQEVERRPSAETRFQLARALWHSGARADAASQIHSVLASGARDARYYELASRIDGGLRGAMYSREAAKLDPRNVGWRSLGLGAAK